WCCCIYWRCGRWKCKFIHLIFLTKLYTHGGRCNQMIRGGTEMEIVANDVLDAKRLACPMPIVKTKKAIKNINPGEVMEVQATDKGSKADLKAWAESTGHQYLGTIEQGETLKHYVRKARESETKETA